jgi:hypothetical protein
MTDERAPSDRHPTDEPDGTTAMAASMRPPGGSVSSGEPRSTDDAGTDDTGTDDSLAGPGADDPDDRMMDGAFGRAVQPGESRAGYDVDAVSGDTDLVRPD